MQLTFGTWRATANTDRTRGELAPREAQHLMALASGLSAKEIAREFGIQPATVKHSLMRVYGRLGVRRGTAAVAEAIRRGWIAPLIILLMVADLHGQTLRARMPVRTRQQSTVTARAAAGGRGPDLGVLIA
ncbi:response regulator transcription factor [Halomonas organivorans]|uniref:DNA-binding CsgD family transcriptional regulator n=1 Tax=Halomonas organivorans TaxID=257772 RepID=A0A7W5C1A5_9GAMM|nr:LuxR C-terminal-related transcriptional regulator [Halomonas organivorans]MBB3142792.1 DNA-binding CsgD family transcriptional regulator [Halomonas organivorans]